MESGDSNVTDVNAQQLARLRAMSADMTVELQRADTKATALCGAVGGLGAAGVTAVPVLDASPFLGLALSAASLLLIAALGAALQALRPMLPRRGAQHGLLTAGRSTDARQLVASLAGLGYEGHRCMEERRLAVIAVLARRKFRAVRLAADLVSIALLVAEIGLLITYMSS
ncbi:Pycsar system effector family protein [Streptomyces apricus]|uniref:Pycsar effector protein domain-containing protein n=1 Tax=Streptomyces apricus TaxID=1828112 RepID=A0A5B0AAU3_9ACTN|nr:Pycsar system effector family protein [Streptomyces apricus]KAA0927008.1 hypothetical protein FGF04_31710 [Streptomyces apricus]